MEQALAANKIEFDRQLTAQKTASEARLRKVLENVQRVKETTRAQQTSHQKMLREAQEAMQRRLEDQERAFQQELRDVRREYEDKHMPELEQSIVLREQKKAQESQALIATQPDPELEAAKRRVHQLEEDLLKREAAIEENVRR